MGFDAATFEVWGALLTGGTLVEVSRETLLTPWRVADELCRLAVDTLFMTPALFAQMAHEVPGAFATLRDLLLGGEAPDPEAVRRVLEAGGPRRLLNAYGPTEGTTFTTWHRVTAASAARARLPLGRPIANSRVVLWGSCASAATAWRAGMWGAAT
jgi:non-ribosomal peptide synthetase component F